MSQNTNQDTPHEAASNSAESPTLRVILASNSPRRHELLTKAGVKHTVHKPSTPIDETLDPDIAAMPAEAAKKLAEKKAGAVVQDLLATGLPSGMYAIIGADTMVVLGPKIYGKPRNLDDAKNMLSELSGNTHDVITGVSLWMLMIKPDDSISLGYRSFADKSQVTFKVLDDEQIANYLRKGESFDKAGAYAIQGEGAALVESTEGELDNIIGLPVTHLLRDFPDLADAI
jgi:septum formation protein